MQLTFHRQPRDAAPAVRNPSQAVAYRLLRGAAGDVERQVVRGRRCDEAPFSRHRTVSADCRHHRASLAILSERQRIRIPGIGVARRIPWSVVVAEECMLQAGALDVLRVERSVRQLPAALRGESCPLRGMAEGHVHAGSFRHESVEEVARVRRGAVGGAPQGQAVAEFHGLQARLAEDVDVGAPVYERVETVRTVPVVVARRDVDGARGEMGECSLDEPGGVGGHPVVLVEVAAAEKGVGPDVGRQPRDALQRVAQRLPAPPRRPPFGSGPREPGVEMQVGEVNDLHARHPVGERVPAKSGSTAPRPAPPARCGAGLRRPRRSARRADRPVPAARRESAGEVPSGATPGPAPRRLR